MEIILINNQLPSTSISEPNSLLPPLFPSFSAHFLSLSISRFFYFPSNQTRSSRSLPSSPPISPIQFLTITSTTSLFDLLPFL